MLDGNDYVIEKNFVLDTSSSSCDLESRQNTRPNTIWWLGGSVAGWLARWLGGWVVGWLEPPPLPPTAQNRPLVSNPASKLLER